MRICFLAKNLELEKGSNGYGGYRRMAYEIIIGLKKKLNGDSVILADKISNFPADIETVAGINLNFKSIFRARKVFKNCDVIHALDVWPPAVIAWLANLGLGKKMIISTVGTASVKPLYQFPKNFLLKKAYLAAASVTAISRYVAGEIKKILPGLKIEVINLGVDLEKFSATHQCNPTHLDKIKKFGKYILSVGDVRKRKGYHVSLAAFKEAIKSMPELNYVVVGFKHSNDYTKSILKYVNDNGLSEKIHFLEDIDDGFLEELYHQAELFILLPVNVDHDFEGFGLVFLEAAANGLAVIATTGNGSEDAVVDGQTGILVPQNDPLAAAQAVIKLISNPELKKAMGGKAKAFAHKMNWDNVISKYLNIYKNLGA